MEIFVRIYEFGQNMVSSLITFSGGVLDILTMDVTDIVSSWEAMGLIDDVLIKLAGFSPLENVQLWQLMFGAGLFIYFVATMVGWLWRLLPW